MSAQKQKEAVFTAVTSVLSEAGIPFSEGENVAPLLTRELRASVTDILSEGFKQGNISLDKTFASDTELRQYCSGLTSNWLRKDARLNGGVKYVAKNPGSRIQDESVKAMKFLLTTVTDEEEKAEIQTFIDERIATLNAARKPVKSVNYDALPEALKSKYTN